MNTKQQKTLELIFKKPVQSDIKWSDIESLFAHLSADISERRGSRMCIALNGIRAVFHRPHPKRETDKGALMEVRKFLINAGIKL